MHIFNRTLAILGCLIVAQQASAMTKNLEGTAPRIGQRGTTVDVTIVGVSIGDPREIIFYKPGIRAVNVRTADEPPKRRGLMHGGRIEEAVVCQFEIAEDCPLGEHPFRLLTATELTCIGTFHVSPFPIIDEEETEHHSNDSLETAKSITPNVSVLGIQSGSQRPDVDIYRVPTKAGQHVSVELDSARIADVHYGDAEFDLALRILDEKGKELGSNDDNLLHVQDPILSIIAPRDGDVFIEVTRSAYKRSMTTYCLHVGTNRRPILAFPPGGQVGTKQDVVLLGDPAGSYSHSVQVPETEGLFDHYDGGPSPIKLSASDFPNLIEDATAEVTKVPQLPIAINGMIDARNDRDRYKLDVKKGEPLHIRLFSATLGSPMDTKIVIRPIGADGTLGKIELEADDATLEERGTFGTNYRARGGQTSVLDPSVLWKPAADGEYQLEVSDPSGQGGALGVYRIEIQSPHTIVQTMLASATFDWTESMRVSGFAIPRGNRWTVNVSLPKGQWNTYDGPFEFIANGLPDGVQLVSPPLTSDAGKWPVQLIADPDAPLTGATFTLEARPIDSDATLATRCQQNVPFINHSGGDAWRAVRVDQYMMGVTDPAPFSLVVESPKVSLVQSGELNIDVEIVRQDGFDGPVLLETGYVHPTISSSPPVIIPSGSNSGTLTLAAKGRPPLGKSPLVVIASTINDSIKPYLGPGHIRVSSDILELDVSAPFVQLTADVQSVRRGETKPFIWKVKHQSEFEGEANVQLQGLPKGVSVVDPQPTLTKDSKELVFQLQATDEALLGKVSGLRCQLSVPVAGQTIVQGAGQASLRIDPKL
ncbi:serine protease [Rosistilla carotiformis]|nr:serine protease [Rosistilla carotiformis]